MEDTDGVLSEGMDIDGGEAKGSVFRGLLAPGYPEGFGDGVERGFG